MLPSCENRIEEVIDNEELNSSSQNDKDEKEDNEAIGQKTLNIIASTEQTDTRTSYEENSNTIKVKWEDDDVIYVGYPSSSNETSINGSGSGFSQFTVSSLSADGKIPLPELCQMVLVEAKLWHFMVKRSISK